MVTLDEVRQEFINYHHVNFGEAEKHLPELDLLVVYGEQHTEVHLGKRSVVYAQLVLKLLRKLSRDKGITVMLSVPHSAGVEALAECGFVKTMRGWLTIC